MSGESIFTREHELVFGTFRFLPRQRLLYRADRPARIGSRAREILGVLLERAGEVVTKNELMARVWPHAIVEEGTLRVHIAGLRKALNDGQEDLRFVESVTGVGYRFVAPLSRLPDSSGATEGTPVSTPVSIEHLGELQQLREENARLRRVIADLSLEKRVLEERARAPGQHHSFQHRIRALA